LNSKLGMTMRRLFFWVFGNRKTGAITIAQAPNLILWIVILAAIIRWVGPASGNLGTALNVVVGGGLLVWAADEIVRGVNPWRRCLGAAVAVWELATMVKWPV
jgi:hypothetical protein